MIIKILFIYLINAFYIYITKRTLKFYIYIIIIGLKITILLFKTIIFVFVAKNKKKYFFLKRKCNTIIQ